MTAPAVRFSWGVRARKIVAVLALASSVAACGGVRDRLRAGPAPDPTRFDPSELVDVLPPGRIPSIDRPRFTTIANAAEWLRGGDPVVVVRVDLDVRAYPLAIMIWHEVVNDVVGGDPIVVTYSPLWNAALAFERRVPGREGVLSFGVAGKLYRSDLVMFDRGTVSLWPQSMGRAALGPLSGTALTPVPAQVSSFAEFRAAFPDGSVLSRETGVERGYGLSPYAGYDARVTPFSDFFPLPADRRLGPMERVVGVSTGAGPRAFRYATLRRAGAVTGDDVVVLWRRGTRSALDDVLIARGRDVGSAGVFRPVAQGRRIDLEATEAGFRDRQTGSTWTVLGVATAGPLAGERLEPVPHLDTFWFAWASSAPATTIAGG